MLENLPLMAEDTKEVVSYALESTSFELKTLMEYYTSSAEQETYARLKTARLVLFYGGCSMRIFRTYFFEVGLKTEGPIHTSIHNWNEFVIFRRRN